MPNPLKDEYFLNKLFAEHNRFIYIKIISLNRQEQPIEEIEGRATSGSISIDGNSAVRRTCNLSLLANEINITDYCWALNTKFKLLIGIENTIDKEKYGEIIWFPQGVFIITSFSCSINANSFTISISGKDKMCLLNGENGGVIPASAELDTVQSLPDENGNISTEQIPIEQIIFYLVSQLGGELIQNIVIEDLGQNSYNLLEYQANTPLYLLKNKYQEIQNMTLEKDTACWIPILDPAATDTMKVVSWTKCTLGEIPYYDTTSNIINVDPTQIIFTDDENEPSTMALEDQEVYTVIKIDSGQPLGYEKNDKLYYPGKGSLKANIGESVTSILDKIKNVLGEYEYFYDLEGKFIFREKQNYLQTSWTPIVEDEDDVGKFYINPLTTSPYIYSFEGSELITSISNSPKIDNIKNDYCIWGERNGVAGGKVPIHIRCAIDKKPEYYCSPWFRTSEGHEINSQIFVTKNYKGSKDNAIVVDWRELIFQMAVDYSLHQDKNPEFLYAIRTTGDNWKYYSNGITGYEQYYIEMQGNWRALYNPFFDVSRERTNNEISRYDQEDYFSELSHQLKNWNKNILNNPEVLDFWFDFFEFNEAQELEKYSVQNIGARPKVAKENNVKAIYYRETPGLLLEVNEDKRKEIGTYDAANGWMVMQINKSFRDKYLSISSQGKSAQHGITEYLNKYTNASDSLSISCIPIYTLEPNTVIQLNDEHIGVSGDYIISTLSIPLSYNGTMSISAKKIIKSVI